MELVQTVSACELRRSCYRVPYTEYYYEVTHSPVGVKEEKLKVRQGSEVRGQLHVHVLVPAAGYGADWTRRSYTHVTAELVPG